MFKRVYKYIDNEQGYRLILLPFSQLAAVNRDLLCTFYPVFQNSTVRVMNTRVSGQCFYTIPFIRLASLLIIVPYCKCIWLKHVSDTLFSQWSFKG